VCASVINCWQTSNFYKIHIALAVAVYDLKLSPISMGALLHENTLNAKCNKLHEDTLVTESYAC